MGLGFLCPMETDRSLTIVDQFFVLQNKLPPGQQKKERDGCGSVDNGLSGTCIFHGGMRMKIP